MTKHFLKVAPFELSTPAAVQFHFIFVCAYPTRARALKILSISEVDKTNINWEQSAGDFWYEALREAASQDRLYVLAQHAIKDVSIRGYHEELRGIVTPAPTPVAPRSTPPSTTEPQSVPPLRASRRAPVIAASVLLVLLVAAVGFALQSQPNPPAPLPQSTTAAPSTAVPAPAPCATPSSDRQTAPTPTASAASASKVAPSGGKPAPTVVVSKPVGPGPVTRGDPRVAEPGNH